LRAIPGAQGPGATPSTSIAPGAAWSTASRSARRSRSGRSTKYPRMIDQNRAGSWPQSPRTMTSIESREEVVIAPVSAPVAPLR